MDKQNAQDGVHKRRITLADGRYLIFYTFDDLPAPSTVEHEAAASVRRPEPEAEPEAEEERRV